MMIDAVKQANATQPSNAPSAAPGATAAEPEEVLPDPTLDLMSCGDPFEKIAALMAQSSRQDRKQARESALHEERSIMAEGRKRVEAMRDEADAIRKEAYVSGGTKIAAGAMQMEGGLQTQHDAVGADLTKEEYTKVLDGSAKGTDGIGEISAGGYKAEQSELRADAAEHESISDAAKRRSEEYRDQARDAREMLNKIATFLREAQSAQNESLKAAILRA